jgi:phosphoribosylglycinamide formyltransferase-1
VPFARYDSRAAWGQALAEQIRPWSPDLLVLSGLMRLLPPSVVSEFGPGIINTHPAYLPEFPGAHGVRDALAAGVTETGASVIKVDDGVDSGPILAQERVPVLPGDSESTLHDRIKPVERRLLIQTILDIANGTTDLKGTTSA